MILPARVHNFSRDNIVAERMIGDTYLVVVRQIDAPVISE